jgi:hypothetical protein
MQVTLISLNPPKVREVNPYAKEPCQEQIDLFGKVIAEQEQLSCWNHFESSLKEWELSEESSKQYNFIGGYEKGFQVWSIGQTLEVEIKDNKAWI